MKARWRWQAGLVAGALLLAGCGTSGGQDASPTTTSATTPTSADAPEPTTTTAPDADDTTTTGAAEAGTSADAERYLALVADPNCAISAFADAESSLSSADTVEDAMRQLQPKAASVAKIYDAFAAGLEAGPWSPEIQDEVDAVRASVDEQAELFHTLAETTDPDEFVDAYEQLMEVVSSTDNPAGELRAELGLPSNEDSDPGCNLAI